MRNQSKSIIQHPYKGKPSSLKQNSPLKERHNSVTLDDILDNDKDNVGSQCDED